MGSSSSRAPRAVLRTEPQLHFKALQVKRDVSALLKGWLEEGAPLGLTPEAFEELWKPGGGCGTAGAEGLFQLFDTDRNRKADAFEILSAAVLLAEGTIEEKVDTLFPIFDFSGGGKLNFDEVNILLHSVSRGVSKVCAVPDIADKELIEACRQMFDAHNLPYDSMITKDQVKRWVRQDVEATRFLQDFHGALFLPDVEAKLAEWEEAQASVFTQLCGDEALSVPAEELFRSQAFMRSLGSPPEEVLRGLVDAMAAQGSSVTLERFTEAARAWNAFATLDTSHEGELDCKELPVLLWLRDHAEPAEGEAERLRDVMGLGPDGRFARAAWLAASLRGSSSP